MQARLFVGAAVVVWALGCGGRSGEGGAPAPEPSPSPSPLPTAPPSPVPTATPAPQPTAAPSPKPAPAAPAGATSGLNLDANGVLLPEFEIGAGNIVDGPIILGESGRAYWRELAPEGTDTWLVAASPDGIVRSRVPIDRLWGFSGKWMRAFDLLVGATIEDCAPGGQRLEARRASDGAVQWTTQAGAVFGSAARACSTFGAPALAGSSVVVQASSCDSASCDHALAWLDARTGAVQRAVSPRQGRTTSADGASPEARGTGAPPTVDAAGNVYVTTAGADFDGSRFSGSQLVAYGPDGAERYRVAAPGLPARAVVGAGVVVVDDSMGPAWTYRAADGSVLRRDGAIPWVMMRDGLFGVAAGSRPEPDGISYRHHWILYKADPETLAEVWSWSIIEGAPFWTSVGGFTRTRSGGLLFHRDEERPTDLEPPGTSAAWLHEHDASGAEVFAVQLPGSGVYDAGSALGDGMLWTFERQSDRRRTGIVRAFRLPGRSPATSGRFALESGNMARDNAER